MNSGRWDENGKIRPGTYINVDGNAGDTIKRGTRGVVLLPLIGNNWGVDKSIVTIKADKPDVDEALLGFKPSEKPLTREALIGAATVIAYIINDGTKATKTITVTAAHDDDPATEVTATAKYKGTRGNDLKVVCAANADSTFEVSILLGTETMEVFTGLTTIATLVDVDSKYIDFTSSDGTATLAAFASQSLAGGTTTTPVTADFTNFLDAAENIKCNAIAIPTSDSSLIVSAIAKAKYMRDTQGKTVIIVVAGATAAQANYEGVINVVNNYKIGDETVALIDATGYVAGITAGADELTSNTAVVHEAATEIVGALANEQAEAAILDGKFFFSYNNDGNVSVEYDINSLHTFTSKRPKDYRKNKIIRVFDAISDTIRGTFPPNLFQNSKLGWDRVDGLGQVLLKMYSDDEGGEGAITEVDYSNDFLVDREKSEGDSMFINVGIKPVDMAEKLYFQVNTR